MQRGLDSRFAGRRTPLLHNPRTIGGAGCVGWWDAAGPITKDGVTDRMQLWEPPTNIAGVNLSGNAYDLAQSTDARQPQWEPIHRPYFIGASNYWVGNTADSAVYSVPEGDDTDWTVFIVYSAEDTGAHRTLFTWSDNSRNDTYLRCYINSTADTRSIGKSTVASGLVTGTFNNDTPLKLRCAIIRATGIAHLWWENGSLVSGTVNINTTALTNLSEFAIGTWKRVGVANSWSGWVHEVALFNYSVANPWQVDALAAYSRVKWGTP